jgi:hypothetical protein
MTAYPSTYKLSAVAEAQIKATSTARLRARLAGLQQATKSSQIIRAYIAVITSELATRPA